MFRIIRNILAVLSLLFALALAVLWLRSYWSVDQFTWTYEKSVAEKHQLIQLITFAAATGGLLIDIDLLNIDTDRMDTLHHVMEPNSFQAGHRWDFETSRLGELSYAESKYSHGLTKGIAGFSFK